MLERGRSVCGCVLWLHEAFESYQNRQLEKMEKNGIVCGTLPCALQRPVLLHTAKAQEGCVLLPTSSYTRSPRQ